MKTAACLAEQNLAMHYTREAYYPIALQFEYYMLDRGCIIAAGTGKTVRISSRTIIFDSAADVIPGTMLQLIVRWPVLYQGREALKWVVLGRVAGWTADGLTLQIEHERLVRPVNRESERSRPNEF